MSSSQTGCARRLLVFAENADCEWRSNARTPRSLHFAILNSLFNIHYSIQIVAHVSPIFRAAYSVSRIQSP